MKPTCRQTGVMCRFFIREIRQYFLYVFLMRVSVHADTGLKG